MFKLTILSMLAITVFAVAKTLLPSSSDVDVTYKTATVERRTLTRSISATGTLEPCDIIDVGAQVAGRVIAFGVDEKTGQSVDYGSHVTKGMVLARIDPSVYEIEVEIAQAQARRAAAMVAQCTSQLKESEAALQRSEAELRQQQAKLRRARSDWERVSKLSNASASSAADVENTRTELESIEAAVAIGNAAIEQAKSHLESRKAAIRGAEADNENAMATLKRAQTTLSYCSILSPIDGTVIDRRVNQGQTVVASLSTPSLFLLASDLRELEIWVSVNEADIGQIRPGLHVRFTVDANPDERHCGTVKQVRLNASMSQNVVTYTVVVIVENTSESLLPYLTANVDFVIDEHADVLTVPSAALRFEPSTARELSKEPELSARTSDASARRTVWISEATGLRQIEVATGISEGSYTEVISSELTEKTQVVVGETVRGEDAVVSNPFVPKMPGTKSPGAKSSGAEKTSDAQRD